MPESCLIVSGLSLLARLVSVTLGLLLLGLVTSEGVAVATLLLSIASSSRLLLTVTSFGLSSVTGITSSRSTASGRSTLRDGDGRRAAAEVTLGSDNLVVVGTELHAGLRPGIEVGADIDAALGAVLLADGPVLLEGLGAVDRGGVGASGLEDLVGAAVNLNGSLALSAAGGVVGAECLNDVVLDERALGPAVDGEVAVTVGGVLSGEADGSAWLVSKTPDQV
ncbi:hypothetical protein HG530_013320 [Fusarium avenaceum]|nr:hypothetical protein HG530_013320 [Fusarium avenaceum]